MIDPVVFLCFNFDPVVLYVEYYSFSCLMTSLSWFSLCAIGLSWSMLYIEGLSPLLRPASLVPARDLSCWSVSWMVGSILLLPEDIEVRDAGS